MKRSKALLVMTLVARRSAAWAHDTVTASCMGDVADEAISRYLAEIKETLEILEDPERGNWIEDSNQQLKEAK